SLPDCVGPPRPRRPSTGTEEPNPKGTPMPLPVRDRIATWSPRKRATLGAAVILAVVALNMIFAYRVGQRHDLFDLRVYAGAVGQWWHGGDLYAYARPDEGRGWGFTYPPFAAL